MRGEQEKPNSLAVAIAVISVLVSVTLAIRYSGQHILEAHPFRQTQTALTAYWLCRNGFHLAYETPSAGAPWSIPFEFPIYEWLVAVLSCSLKFDLERTGRLLSYAFLLACLAPVSQILRRLFPSEWRLQFAIFLPLFLLSPLYLFWGRSFMIETAALFFTLAGVWAALPFINGSVRWVDALLSFALLTLALLQKSTTALPIWMLLLVLIALQSKENWMARIRRLCSAKVIVAFVIPFLIAFAWTRFTDEVKMHNLAGHRLTSAGLADWNFGTIGMRFSVDLWYHAVFNRIISRNVGGPIGILLLGAALFWLSKRERRFIILNLAAFLLPILIFENLHFVHDYYQTANVLYLVLAVAIAIAGLLKRFPQRRMLLLASFVGILAIDVVAFLYTGYATAERVHFSTANSRTLALAEYLKSHTSAQAPLVVFGLDWSAELPFYAERRALGVPNWFTPAQQRDIVSNPANYVGRSPSAIVFCGNGYDDLKKLAEANSLSATHSVADCEINDIRH